MSSRTRNPNVSSSVGNKRLPPVCETPSKRFKTTESSTTTTTTTTSGECYGLDLYDSLKKFETLLSEESTSMSYTTKSGHTGIIPIHGGLLLDHKGSKVPETIFRMSQDDLGESIITSTGTLTPSFFTPIKTFPSVNLTPHHKNLNVIYRNRCAQVEGEIRTDSLLIKTRATLVLCSGNSLVKWTSKHNFSPDQNLSVLVIDSKRSFNSVSYSDILKANLVIVSHEAFLSKYYQKNPLEKRPTIFPVKPKTSCSLCFPTEPFPFELRDKLDLFLTQECFTKPSTVCDHRIPDPGLPWLSIMDSVKSPILESFQWKRLIVDDAHLVFETSASKKRRCKFFEFQIQALARWYMSIEPFKYGDLSSCGILHFISAGDIPYTFAEFFDGKKFVRRVPTISEDTARILSDMIKNNVLISSLGQQTQDSTGDSLKELRPKTQVHLLEFSDEAERIIYSELEKLDNTHSEYRDLVDTFCVDPVSATNIVFGKPCLTLEEGYAGFVKKTTNQLEFSKKLILPRLLELNEKMESSQYHMSSFLGTISKLLQEHLPAVIGNDHSPYLMCPDTGDEYFWDESCETNTYIICNLHAIHVPLSNKLKLTHELLENITQEDFLKITNYEAKIMALSGCYKKEDTLKKILLPHLIGQKVSEDFLMIREYFLLVAKRCHAIALESKEDFANNSLWNGTAASWEVYHGCFERVALLLGFLSKSEQYLEGRSMAHVLFYFRSFKNNMREYITSGLEAYSLLLNRHDYISGIVKQKKLVKHSPNANLIDDTCVICQETFSGVVDVLDCGHKFCHSCLDSWKKKTNTCPTCRRDYFDMFITCFLRETPDNPEQDIEDLPTANLSFSHKYGTKVRALKRLLSEKNHSNSSGDLITTNENDDHHHHHHHHHHQPFKTVLITRQNHATVDQIPRILSFLCFTGNEICVYQGGQKKRNKAIAAFEGPCLCTKARCTAESQHQKILLMDDSALSCPPPLGKVDRIIFMGNIISQLVENELLDLVLSGTSKTSLPSVSIHKFLVNNTQESKEYTESWI